MTTVDIALSYLRAGFSVVPVVGSTKHCPRGFRWGQYRQRRMTEDELRRTWERYPDAGIAIVCGPVSDNVEAIDADDVELAQDLKKQVPWNTYVERTPRGAMHFVLRVRKPLGTDRIGFAPHIDLKAGGLLVVAPTEGYQSLDGNLWEAALPEVESLEDWASDLLSDVGVTPVTHERGPIDVTWRPHTIGDRRKRCVSLAGLLRRYGADYDLILDYLRHVNGYPSLLPSAQEPLPESEIEEVARSVTDRYVPGVPEVLNEPDEHKTAATIEDLDDLWITASDVVETTPRVTFGSRFVLGAINLFVGPSSSAKSFVFSELAARFTTGAPWPDGSGNAPLGDVLWIGAEEDLSSIVRPRLRRHHADLNRVRLLKTGRRVTFGGDLSWLTRALDDHPKTVAIYIDPFLSYVPDNWDMNVSTNVRTTLSKLQDVVSTRGIVAVPVIHLNKNREGTTLERILGSGAFREVPRSILACTRNFSEPGLVFYLGQLKAQGGMEAPTLRFRAEGPSLQGWIEWDGPSDMSVDEIIGEQSLTPSLRRVSGKSSSQPSKLEDAKDLLRAELAEGPRMQSELNDLAAAHSPPISSSTLYKASEALGVKRYQGEVAEAGKRKWWWALKNGGKP